MVSDRNTSLNEFFPGGAFCGWPATWDVLCVLGPTASGKTRYAVDLALRAGSWNAGIFVQGAEILSADSRQVYRGMDIGTGKDLADYRVNLLEYVRRCGEKGMRLLWGRKVEELEREVPAGLCVEVPCHLTDIADAGTKYNIFEYQRDFAAAYAGVRERGRMPILCGGSGLYIEAATRGYELKEVLPDPALRERLEPLEMSFLVELLTWLKALRGGAPHNESDFDTKKRAVRAIEIALAESGITCGVEEVLGCFERRAGGKRLCGGSAGVLREDPAAEGWHTGREACLLANSSVSATSSLSRPVPQLPQRCRYIGISVDRETRNARIDARLKARLREGMVEEVKRLLDGGIPAEDLIYYGLEYKFVTQYLTGELTPEQMEERLAIAIHQFAKRQMTWFRGMERRGINIEWRSL